MLISAKLELVGPSLYMVLKYWKVKGSVSYHNNCTIFHGSPSNCCWNVLLKTSNVSFMVIFCKLPVGFILRGTWMSVQNIILIFLIVGRCFSLDQHGGWHCYSCAPSWELHSVSQASKEDVLKWRNLIFPSRDPSGSVSVWIEIISL